MTNTILCSVSALEDPGSIAIDLHPDDESKRFFVVKHNDALYAYRNICPHVGAPLNWQSSSFLNRDKDFIQCSLHGALFKINSGQCVAGPCRGSNLMPVSIEIKDGDILLLE